MSFISHKYGRTFVKKIIPKSKQKKVPTLFVHGGPGSTHNYYLPLVPYLNNFEIYFYDQIGCGESSKLEKKYWKISTFVEELNTIVKKLNLKEYNIVSSSWGCVVALEYIYKYKPKGLKKLVLQSPLVDAHDWHNDAQFLINKLDSKTKKVIKTCHEIDATDAKVYQKAVLKFYEKHVLRNKKILYGLNSRKVKMAKDIYEYMWGVSEFFATGTLKNYSFKNKLSHINNVNTLFICGEFDEARPVTIKKYQQKIKSSNFKIIKNASHAISLEQPQKYAKVLSEFLNEKNS